MIFPLRDISWYDLRFHGEGAEVNECHLPRSLDHPERFCNEDGTAWLPVMGPQRVSARGV